MNKQQAIEQLKDLRIDRQSFLDNNNRDINEIYENDIKAIDLAIKALEGTAQEVPVQEQSDEIADKVIEKMANALADALSN